MELWLICLWFSRLSSHIQVGLGFRRIAVTSPWIRNKIWFVYHVSIAAKPGIIKRNICKWEEDTSHAWYYLYEIPLLSSPLLHASLHFQIPDSEYPKLILQDKIFTNLFAEIERDRDRMLTIMPSLCLYV